ncbi:hypothetical protein BAY59_26870 [Prauserella coralliicola]|nr:hypothetical protein BAY59_26870 [Prauserella coralliicola]
MAAPRAQGFTLDDLAERSGVSKRTLSYAEGGLINVGLLNLAHLAEALGVPVAELAQPVLDAFDEYPDDLHH